MSGSGAYGRDRPGLSRRPGRHYRGAMTDKHEKAERLAAALRENLRRRKAQAREQAAPKRPETAGDEDKSTV